MDPLHLTRQHLRGFGLTMYQARVISTPCPIQGKTQGLNLYRMSDILQAGHDYIRKPRIRATTRRAVERLIQELSALTDNVVNIPFGANPNVVAPVVKELMKSKTATQSLKLRAAALKGTSTHV